MSELLARIEEAHAAAYSRELAVLLKDCAARIRELEAGVACWVKQLGRRPIEFGRESGLHLTMEWDWDDSGEQLYRCYRPNHRAGADPSEWPEDLRVQEDAE